MADTKVWSTLKVYMHALAWKKLLLHFANDRNVHSAGKSIIGRLKLMLFIDYGLNFKEPGCSLRDHWGGPSLKKNLGGYRPLYYLHVRARATVDTRKVEGWCEDKVAYKDLPQNLARVTPQNFRRTGGQNLFVISFYQAWKKLKNTSFTFIFV